MTYLYIYTYIYVCVCVYICIYIYILCMYVCTVHTVYCILHIDTRICTIDDSEMDRPYDHLDSSALW